MPHLTGQPIPITEEGAPPVNAPAWRRLQYFLFFVPHQPRGKREIIRWWENRRFAYNVIVGAFGLLTVLAVALSLRGQLPWPAATILVLVVGVAANICYCLSWLSEIVLQRYFVRHYRHRVAHVLMNLVLGISLSVVLAPTALVAALVLLGIIP